MTGGDTYIGATNKTKATLFAAILLSDWWALRQCAHYPHSQNTTSTKHTCFRFYVSCTQVTYPQRWRAMLHLLTLGLSLCPAMLAGCAHHFGAAHMCRTLTRDGKRNDVFIGQSVVFCMVSNRAGAARTILTCAGRGSALGRAS